MGLAELKKDATRLRERLSKLVLPEDPAKACALLLRELTNNVAPLLEATLEALHEEVVVPVDELAAAVDELIDQSEDVLHAETTAKILGVFVAGAALAGELEKLLPKADEAARKVLAASIAQYRQAATEVGEMLQEITLDDNTPGPAGEEGDDEPEDATS